MREDPGYFLESVTERYEHTLENLLPKPKKKPGDDWQCAIEKEVMNSMWMVEVWKSLDQLMDDLSRQHTLHKSSVSFTVGVPEDLARTAYKIRDQLIFYVSVRFSAMAKGFYASPPLRLLSRVQDPCEDQLNMRSKSLRHNSNKSAAIHLSRMITALCDASNFATVGLDTLMDEFEKLMDKDANAKEMLTGWVLNQHSEVSVLYQCLFQIRLLP